MKIGIIGLQGSGKTTLFEAILRRSGQDIAYGNYGEERLKPHLGAVPIRDGRLAELSKALKPKKTTFAELVLMDRPGFDMAHAREADGLMLVIGLFMARDGAKEMKDVEAELILSDLGIIQNRLKRLEKEIKSKEASDALEYELLVKCGKVLEDGGLVKDVGLSEHEKTLLNTYQFLTLKSVLAALNIAESEIGKDMPPDIADLLSKGKTRSVTICAKTELEIMDLEEAERGEFLKSLGLGESGMKNLIGESFAALELIQFFTMKGDEARAWPIKRGTKALDAAGKVHTDMKRGFIRAEVVNFDAFAASGFSIQETKAKGHLRLEGRDYVVKDGDIIDFRFSV